MAELQGLAELAKIGGIAALALGILLVIFRDVIQARIFSKLSPRHSFELIRLALVFSFSAFLIGTGTWYFAQRAANERARCVPIVTAKDPFDPKMQGVICKDDEAAARKQAVESALVVQEPIMNMLSVQSSYFSEITRSYLENPTKSNWYRVIEYVKFIDKMLQPSIAALSEYENSSGRTAGTDALRRLMKKRFDILAKISTDEPQNEIEIIKLNQQYYDLTVDTFCALSSFIRDNGGTPPPEPPGLVPGACD